MNLTANGLVIRAVDYRDNDRILTVMTQENGKLTVKAQGVRKKSSRLIAASQLFAYSNMDIYENKGFFTLNEAQVLEQFYQLANDLDGLALASYFCELLATEGEENSAIGDMLRLALNSLFALCKKLYPAAQIKAAFELRFMAIAGYMPSKQQCESLCPTAASAANYILSADLKKLFAFKIDDSSQRELGDFAEKYTCDKLERGFKTLDFYNSIKL